MIFVMFIRIIFHESHAMSVVLVPFFVGAWEGSNR